MRWKVERRAVGGLGRPTTASSGALAPSGRPVPDAVEHDVNDLPHSRLGAPLPVSAMHGVGAGEKEVDYQLGIALSHAAVPDALVEEAGKSVAVALVPLPHSVAV